MAQYGRNYYGGSYYGLSGVFAGQFVSDQTALITALSDTAPSDGKLYVDLACSHPRINYPIDSEVYMIEGTWTSGSSSDSAFKLTASIVASNFYIKYTPRADGCVVSVEVKTYINGTLSETNTYSVDTTSGESYFVDGLQFGEQIITMTKNNTLSGAADVFQFSGIEATVTDVKLEMRKGTNDVYGDWINVPIVAAESDVSYLGFSNVYRYEASTPDWAGADGYQFKLMMASSDNTITPEVIIADVHTSSAASYSDSGFWKTTVDLGADIDSIDSVIFSGTIPDGCKLDVRTRTSDTDGNWGEWSVPYSTDTTRASLNYKTTPTIKDGFILTPAISPENITNWQSFKLRHVLNYLDTLSGATAPGQSITVEIVTPDYHPNPQTLAENQANVSRVLKTFTYTNDTQVDRIISELAVPSVRFKINLHRELNVSSPAVEHVYTVSNAYYKEYKTFGTGDSDLRGYGSAVYGQNTGVDKVYTNGVGRTDEAKISSLSFTVPSGAENPDYVIEVDPLFSEVYTAEEVDIYWNSNSSKMTKLEGALTDDYLVVKVSEPKDAGRVKRHYRYGSGLATTIYPSYLSTAITNTFSPSLEDSREYAYYIMNGFTFGTPNNNLSIRWSSENEVAADSRRNVTYSIDDFVFVSIITSQAKNLVDWISEEKKFDAIVNNNDVLQSYTVTLTYDEDPAKSQIPEIESDVIVNSDPTIIPYKVEVIEGSVFSHGTRKSESVITPTVRYIYSVTGTPSLKEQVEEKIMVIRTPGTNVDRLPKAMVKKLNGTVGGKVLGVYSNPALYMPDFTNKINPTTGEENETGDYKYYAATGTYNNAIDWAPAIAAGTAPDEGSTYYVSYVYDKVISLRVELACDYSEYEPTLQIYKSPTITHSGECMPMADYISDPMAFTDFTVPADVDRSTLRYVVYDNSSRVRTYVDDNRVVGTLDSRDPKVNWNPNINGGYYYINKDSYYMFVNPVEHTLDNTLIPIAKNVSYTDGYNGTGILIEEGTTNLAPSFSKGLTRTLSFSSSFAEEGLALTPTTWDELGTLPVNTLETRTWNELEGTV